MMHWVALPIEQVFEGFSEYTPEYQETTWQGVQMMVENTGDGYGRIVRLLSCNSYDYLRKDYEPGQKIPLFHQST